MKGELIGLNVRVISSKNKEVIGISGRLIDETKNTFLVETKDGKKRLLKEQCLFEFEYGKKRIQLKGEILLQRPEDRLKAKLAKLK